MSPRAGRRRVHRKAAGRGHGAEHGARRRAPRLLAVALIGAIVGAAVLVLGAYQVGTRWAAAPEPTPTSIETPTPTPTRSPPPDVLPAAIPASNPAGALVDRLEMALSGSGLGERVGAVVTDLSGTTVIAHQPDVAMTPASTMKILTSLAVLDVLGPDHRFHTSVVTRASPSTGPAEATGPVEIALVGGGDPMLTAASELRLGATSLAELAGRTAQVLTDAGVNGVRLLVDDTMFSGPAVDDDWESHYVPGSVVAPVSALAVDGGRREPGTQIRSADPALAAANAFAGFLAQHGIRVDPKPVRGTISTAHDTLATVRSAPVADIVEHVLATSDNEAAEVLARHVALGSGRPGTAEAASEATGDVLARLGLDVSGAAILDGSGLARGNALPAALLTEALAVAADPARPDLRPVITGLPVAGFTGTLTERMDEGSSAGVVRAKTGTLTGVSSLAGVVVAGDSPYLFAVLADQVTNTVEARAAIDGVVAALVGPG